MGNKWIGLAQLHPALATKEREFVAQWLGKSEENVTLRITLYDQSNLDVHLFKNIHFPILQRYQIPILPLILPKE
jgi:hypothetical protein